MTPQEAAVRARLLPGDWPAQRQALCPAGAVLLQPRSRPGKPPPTAGRRSRSPQRTPPLPAGSLATAGGGGRQAGPAPGGALGRALRARLHRRRPLCLAGPVLCCVSGGLRLGSAPRHAAHLQGCALRGGMRGPAPCAPGADHARPCCARRVFACLSRLCPRSTECCLMPLDSLAASMPDPATAAKPASEPAHARTPPLHLHAATAPRSCHGCRVDFMTAHYYACNPGWLRAYLQQHRKALPWLRLPASG